jgi:hypothetical protein
MVIQNLIATPCVRAIINYNLSGSRLAASFGGGPDACAHQLRCAESDAIVAIRVTRVSGEERVAKRDKLSCDFNHIGVPSSILTGAPTISE